MIKQTGIATKSNLEALERFVHKKDITLTVEQEELMQRIMHADEKSRSGIHDRQAIIESIVTRFSVSKWRADQDISDAHKLFGGVRKLNKNYLLSRHIERIEKHIKIAETARNLKELRGLNDSLTHALNSLPQEVENLEATPTTIIFIVKAPDEQKKKTVEDLLKEAEAITKQLPENEYIEFEESA